MKYFKYKNFNKIQIIADKERLASLGKDEQKKIVRSRRLTKVLSITGIVFFICCFAMFIYFIKLIPIPTHSFLKILRVIGCVLLGMLGLTISAYVKYDDNKLHKITYDGSLELSYIQIQNDPPYSRLTKDYTFENSGVMRMLYYGDTYGLGGANWLVEVMDNTEKMNGDYFRVNLVANDNTYSADSVWGTYTAVATEDEVAKGKFVAGTEAGINEYYHSWYWVIEDNLVNHDYGAPLSTGSVNIAKDGSSYIMTIDCMDDNGHKIQGTYTCGGIEVYDMTTM